jgi:hypothetical protein
LRRRRPRSGGRQKRELSLCRRREEETREPPCVWKTRRVDEFVEFSSLVHGCKPGYQTGRGGYFRVTGWAGKSHVYTLTNRSTKQGLRGKTQNVDLATCSLLFLNI